MCEMFFEWNNLLWVQGCITFCDPLPLKPSFFKPWVVNGRERHTSASTSYLCCWWRPTTRTKRSGENFLRFWSVQVLSSTMLLGGVALQELSKVFCFCGFRFRLYSDCLLMSHHTPKIKTKNRNYLDYRTIFQLCFLHICVFSSNLSPSPHVASAMSRGGQPAASTGPAFTSTMAGDMFFVLMVLV